MRNKICTNWNRIAKNEKLIIKKETHSKPYWKSVLLPIMNAVSLYKYKLLLETCLKLKSIDTIQWQIDALLDKRMGKQEREFFIFDIDRRF